MFVKSYMARENKPTEIHDNQLHTSNSIKFIHVSKDGLSVSSSDNCEDSSAFLVEGMMAITLETMSVKSFAL